MQDRERVERVVKMLGGWPRHFNSAERGHGLSLLVQLLRDRLLDETVFGMVQRYATHRAAYDKLGAEIASQAKAARKGEALNRAPGDGSYLSGEEQARAYHFNKLLTLERELLATPYARVRNGGSAQTSFMDLLHEAPKEVGGDNKVTPFKPMGRGAGRG